MTPYERLVDLRKQISEANHAFLTESDKLIEKGNVSAGRRSRTISSKLAKLHKEYRSASLITPDKPKEE